MEKSRLYWPIFIHSALSVSTLAYIFYLIFPDLPDVIAGAGFWTILTIFPLLAIIYISIGPLFGSKETIVLAGRFDALIGVITVVLIIWKSSLETLLVRENMLFLMCGIFLILLGVALVHSKNEQVMPEITDGPVKTMWWPWGPDNL